MSRCISLAALLVAAAAAAPGQERWVLQTALKVKQGAFVLRDLKFASESRGVAVGCVQRGRECRPASFVTIDGGKNWRMVPIEAVGRSLFFLNETAGWVIAEDGVYRTTDVGLHWTRLPDSPATRSALALCFLDENHGWIAGAGKAVYVTSDGGGRWEPVPAAQQVDTKAEYTAFNWIVFADERSGMIAGASLPPQAGQPARTRETPHLTIFLDTRDGGKTWKAATTSMFGRVVKVVFTRAGRGLGLIEFLPGFEYPSEVFALDWRTGQSSRSFRQSDCAVTDVAFQGDMGYLAGVAAPRKGRAGRVKFYRSKDLDGWVGMSVPGRAEGHRVILALNGQRGLWAASDSGLLFRLEGN